MKKPFNMQRGYKILIIGAAALAAGIILTLTVMVVLKQSSFNINASMETVSPGKSIFKTSEVSRGAKMAIGINSKPSDIPVNLQIIERPGLAKILDVNFTGSLFKNFISNRDGEDTMMITNLGSKEVSANTVFGNSDFFDASGQPKIFLGAVAVSGIMLSFVSILIIIAGGIILFIDRRRAKRMKPKE